MKRFNRGLKREGELVCTWEGLVGGMGPTEVGGDSHFAVKFEVSIKYDDVFSVSTNNRPVRHRFGNLLIFILFLFFVTDLLNLFFNSFIV